MAELLNFELVAPDRLIFSGEVEQVTVPGLEGDFTVLAGHAPVLSTIRPGVVDIVVGESDTQRYFVRGGFAEATPQGLSVLAEQAIALADLSREQLAGEIKNAEDDVADAGDDATRTRAQETLNHLRQLAEAL